MNMNFIQIVGNSFFAVGCVWLVCWYMKTDVLQICRQKTVRRILWAMVVVGLAMFLAGCTHFVLPNGVSYTAIGINTSIDAVAYNPDSEAWVIVGLNRSVEPNLIETLKDVGYVAGGMMIGGGGL